MIPLVVRKRRVLRSGFLHHSHVIGCVQPGLDARAHVVVCWRYQKNDRCLEVRMGSTSERRAAEHSSTLASCCPMASALLLDRAWNCLRTEFATHTWQQGHADWPCGTTAVMRL